MELFRNINLRLFGEGTGDGGGTGADGSVGAEAPAQSEATALPKSRSQKANPLSNVVYGIQDNEVATDNEPKEEPKTPTPEERQAAFEKMIKGEYKDLYDARVQETISKRFKGESAKASQLDRMNTMMSMLADKYGVKAGKDGSLDYDAISKAIEDDDSYYENEALEKGMSVSQLKEFKSMERQNAELKRQMDAERAKENADRLYATWAKQAEETKALYPQFNIQEEMENPEFVKLIRSNVSVRTAFEVLHQDKIFPAMMQYTAEQTEQKLANKIRSNGMRPAENGNSSQSAVTIKSDVSQLSKADRQEIIRRVQRGEKIRF